MEDLDIDLDFEGIFEDDCDKRYVIPQKIKHYKDRQIIYSNAVKLAKDLDFTDFKRYFTFISGNFIFGDFIEALIVEKNLHIKKMDISTLSLNENNVDSLANLINGDYVNEINLIVSDYFYENEKFKTVPYIFEKLDIANKFQIAVARSHTKTCIFETYDGDKYVIHGSANLRSSDNIEQIDIEVNFDLFDFIDNFNKVIIQEYLTINKKVGGKKLWQSLQCLQKVEKKEEAEKMQLQKEHQKEHKF